MEIVVFNGSWMGGSTLGVNRYAENILGEIDKVLEYSDIDVEIRVLVPVKRKLICYKHINVVVKGKCDTKLEKYLWEQIVFPMYVSRQNAVGIDLTLGLPVFGVKYIALHDCIYESFPENYHRHQMHRYLYLMKAFLLSHNRKYILLR